MRPDSSPDYGGAGFGEQPIPPQFELSAILAHPRFPEAVRTFAEGMVALHSRSRVLGWFLSDRILAILAHAAVALDADLREDDPRSGLTPGRFKAFCARTGLCSEGRATAVLAFMRLSGHLEADTHPADRRITRLRPSPKLLDTMRARLRVQLAAASLVCPDLVEATDRLGSEAFEREMSLEFLRRFIGGTRVLGSDSQLRLFTDRDVGALVLFALMLGADPAHPLPPSGPMPFSIAALARRFNVSRTHILRLVRDAETAGLLSRVGQKGELVVFSPDLQQSLRRLFASLFQLASVCLWTAMQVESDATSSAALR